MGLLVRWLVSAIAVWLAAELVTGIHLGPGWAPILLAPVLLGLVNAVVRPILAALSCGLIVLTLGLFHFVINALMLLLTSWLAGAFGIAFRVDGFLPALVGAVVIGVVSFLLSLLVRDRRR